MLEQVGIFSLHWFVSGTCLINMKIIILHIAWRKVNLTISLGCYCTSLYLKWCKSNFIGTVLLCHLIFPGFDV